MIDADPAAIATFLLVFLLPGTQGRDASALRVKLAQMPRAVGHAIRVPPAAGPGGADRDVRRLREARDAYLKLTAVLHPSRADRSETSELPRGERGATR